MSRNKLHTTAYDKNIVELLFKLNQNDSTPNPALWQKIAKALQRQDCIVEWKEIAKYFRTTLVFRMPQLTDNQNLIDRWQYPYLKRVYSITVRYNNVECTRDNRCHETVIKDHRLFIKYDTDATFDPDVVNVFKRYRWKGTRQFIDINVKDPRYKLTEGEKCILIQLDEQRKRNKHVDSDGRNDHPSCSTAQLGSPTIARKQTESICTGSPVILDGVSVQIDNNSQPKSDGSACDLLEKESLIVNTQQYDKIIKESLEQELLPPPSGNEIGSNQSSEQHSIVWISTDANVSYVSQHTSDPLHVSIVQEHCSGTSPMDASDRTNPYSGSTETPHVPKLPEDFFTDDSESEEASETAEEDDVIVLNNEPNVTNSSSGRETVVSSLNSVSKTALCTEASSANNSRGNDESLINQCPSSNRSTTENQETAKLGSMVATPTTETPHVPKLPDDFFTDDSELEEASETADEDDVIVLNNEPNVTNSSSGRETVVSSLNSVSKTALHTSEACSANNSRGNDKSSINQCSSSERSNTENQTTTKLVSMVATPTTETPHVPKLPDDFFTDDSELEEASETADEDDVIVLNNEPNVTNSSSGRETVVSSLNSVSKTALHTSEACSANNSRGNDKSSINQCSSSERSNTENQTTTNHIQNESHAQYDDHQPQSPDSTYIPKDPSNSVDAAGPEEHRRLDPVANDLFTGSADSGVNSRSSTPAGSHTENERITDHATDSMEIANNRTFSELEQPLSEAISNTNVSEINTELKQEAGRFNRSVNDDSITESVVKQELSISISIYSLANDGVEFESELEAVGEHERSEAPSVAEPSSSSGSLPWETIHNMLQPIMSRRSLLNNVLQLSRPQLYRREANSPPLNALELFPIVRFILFPSADTVDFPRQVFLRELAYSLTSRILLGEDHSGLISMSALLFPVYVGADAATSSQRVSTDRNSNKRFRARQTCTCQNRPLSSDSDGSSDSDEYAINLKLSIPKRKKRKRTQQPR
ncbi:mucin-4-like [Malaya genurostris]|uniref:mucin-4-like n=1 Tax=Malaya genurostris TaxID=325434 RepID=UPI0026F38239|nr:mucin-4-like [Malaya genurostris]